MRVCYSYQSEALTIEPSDPSEALTFQTFRFFQDAESEGFTFTNTRSPYSHYRIQK